MDLLERESLLLTQRLLRPLARAAREWAAEIGDAGEDRDLAMYRLAEEERLLKLREANLLLAEQQEELNRLRVALAEERARVDWLTKGAEVFERAATERLALLEKSSDKPGSDPGAPGC
jgi:hypothetical protein